MTTEERFWGRVDSSGGPDACWPWTRGRNHNYGTCWFRRRAWRAHRVAWVLTNGEVSAGLCVCHRCDNPICCNPAHLFLGTREDNNADKLAKGRHAHGDSFRKALEGRVHGLRLHPERVPSGERHWSTKLTADAVRSIRARYGAGQATQRQRAAEYGVRENTVSAIVRRINWRHVA